MADNPSPFDQALSNFTFGVANRDLICHMAAEGYSVRQIKEATDYPVSVEKIAETVWECYIETGVIRLSLSEEEDAHYDYVMDIGKYGKRSFRRVESDRKSNAAVSTYIPCAFGVVKHQDSTTYQKILKALDSRKRDYIDGLPWPPQIVYHADNQMMREIRSILQEEELWPSA